VEFISARLDELIEKVSEGKTDVHQLRVGVSRGLDRCEIVIADGAACFRERADEADRRIALGIAGALALAAAR
jgi:hypothetical protein